MHTQMRFSMATNPFRSCSELQAAKGLNTKKSCWCVQSGQLLLRQQPLFALRVTELGDGSSVLAATFLHVLADGMRIMQALKDLAAAYRGQSSLPEPHPARVGTVAQLVHAVEQIGGPVPAALLDPRLAQPVPEAVSRRLRRTLESEEGCYAALADYSFVRRVPAAQPPDMDRVLTVGIAAGDLAALRGRLRQHAAVQALPNVYISRNDIVFAIAWLLGCDMRQRPRAGMAPAGSASVGAVTLDLVGNDADGKLSRALVPAGAIQNMVMPLPVVVLPDKLPQPEHAATLDALLHSLGLAAAACRAAILRVPTGQILDRWVEQAGFPFRPAPPQSPAPDVYLANWNQLKGCQEVDFGHGPPEGLTGMIDLHQATPTAVFPAPKGPVLLLDVSPGMLARLQASPVFELLPSSGLMAM